MQAKNISNIGMYFFLNHSKYLGFKT